VTLRGALIRLLGGTPGDGDGQARPSAQMSEAFGQMLDDNARLLQEARLSTNRLRSAMEDLRTTQTRVVEGETLVALDISEEERRAVDFILAKPDPTEALRSVMAGIQPRR
jgi:hypothetical protein